MVKIKHSQAIQFLLLVASIVLSSTVNAEGAQIFQTECAHCHSLEQDASAKVGPALADLIDKPAGKEVGYDYSEALISAASAGLVWDENTLDKFLLAPNSIVDGSKMAYSGLEDEGLRSVLIAWLKETSVEELAAISKQMSQSVSPEVMRIQEIKGDPEYGEYLAAECVTCHAGGSGGVPPIEGLGRAYFIQSLLDYSDGTRTNQVMQLMTANLGDDELAALAAYFTKEN
ncbi:MAG: c-type cytochrome [Gammaproteobacteria bacterium]|nr:c-type cytochrome [Gammaproteobacteria bacterium]